MLSTVMVALSTTAIADPIKVQPIRFLGPDAPTRAYVRAVLDGMEDKFAEAGIDVDALRIKTHLNPWKDETTLSNINQAFRKQEGWSVRRGYTNPYAPTLALTGRAQGLYLYGFANRTMCYGRCNGFAVAAIAETNAAGESRYPQSVVAATHELGHLLGAQHVNEYPNIMHADAMRYVPTVISNYPWAQSTVAIMQWRTR